MPLLSQQPEGQLFALQTQAPLTQACPEAQAVPLLPQTHWPLEQLSAVMPQTTHVPPLVPQLEAVGGVWQTLPAQQPVGQLVASHTHTPLTQRVPAGQFPVLPQVHAPLTQLSPAGQTVVQLPQWFGSLLTSVQVPPQFICPLAQHSPLEQLLEQQVLFCEQGAPFC